jgi:hypothetical protein
MKVIYSASTSAIIPLKVAILAFITLSIIFPAVLFDIKKSTLLTLFCSYKTKIIKKVPSFPLFFNAFFLLSASSFFNYAYHQTTDRVSGHIFISVLAYHILNTIRHQLKQHGINDSWQTVVSKLNNHYRITNSLQRKDNKPIHIRKSMRANPKQLAIYNACNVSSAILTSTITTY